MGIVKLQAEEPNFDRISICGEGGFQYLSSQRSSSLTFHSPHPQHAPGTKPELPPSTRGRLENQNRQNLRIEAPCPCVRPRASGALLSVLHGRRSGSMTLSIPSSAPCLQVRKEQPAQQTCEHSAMHSSASELQWVSGASGDFESISIFISLYATYNISYIYISIPLLSSLSTLLL